MVPRYRKESLLSAVTVGRLYSAAIILGLYAWVFLPSTWVPDWLGLVVFAEIAVAVAGFVIADRRDRRKAIARWYAERPWEEAAARFAAHGRRSWRTNVVGRVDRIVLSLTPWIRRRRSPTAPCPMSDETAVVGSFTIITTARGRRSLSFYTLVADTRELDRASWRRDRNARVRRPVQSTS